MIRRSAKWSFRLGVVVAIAFVVKKLLDSKRESATPLTANNSPSSSSAPSRPAPAQRPTPTPPPAPLPTDVAAPAPVEPEPKQDPVAAPEPAAEAMGEPSADEPAPVPEPEPEPEPVDAAPPEPTAEIKPLAPEATTEITPVTPEPAPAKNAAKKAASKRPARTEPLKAQRVTKKAGGAATSKRKVPVDAAPADRPHVMVSWVEPVGDVCPTSHPIKAKLSSRVFRKPGTPSYEASKPDRCYASESAALRAGFKETQR